MNWDQWRPFMEGAESLAVGIAAVVVASQVADLCANARARANGATRDEARVCGRDAGMVTILVAVVGLALAASFGWW